MAPGTPCYMSPEMFEGQEYYDYKTDIWSLGIIFYELLYSKIPFNQINHVKLLNEIKDFAQNVGILLPKDKCISIETKNLLIKMLELDKIKRATLEEILRSSLFTIDNNKTNQGYIQITRNTSITDHDPQYYDHTHQNEKSLELILFDESYPNDVDLSANLTPISHDLIKDLKEDDHNQHSKSTNNNNNDILNMSLNESVQIEYINIEPIEQNVQDNPIPNNISTMTLPKLNFSSKAILVDSSTNLNNNNKITVVKADENSVVDIMMLSITVDYNSIGLKMFKDRLNFEIGCIKLLNHMIWLIKKKLISMIPSLSLTTHNQLIYSLLKLSCIKYTTIIKPIYNKKINTVSIPQHIWDAIKYKQEFIDCITIAENSVNHLCIIYPKFYAKLKLESDKNPYNKPLSQLDKNFLDILNYEFDDQEKVIQFLQDILIYIKELHKEIITNKEFCILLFDTINDFIKILKSESIIDTKQFYKTHDVLRHYE